MIDRIGGNQYASSETASIWKALWIAVLAYHVGGGAKQRQQRQQQESAAQQTQANQQAQITSYNKAKGACLEGRGYTVK